MSSNQIGGFFNRLEASRKYLFGSMGVLGKANDSVITGVLVCRGKEYQPVVDVAPDWESYSYEAIDLADEKQKAFFEGAMAWDLELDGRAWADGKNVSSSPPYGDDGGWLTRGRLHSSSKSQDRARHGEHRAVACGAPAKREGVGEGEGGGIEREPAPEIELKELPARLRDGRRSRRGGRGAAGAERRADGLRGAWAGDMTRDLSKRYLYTAAQPLMKSAPQHPDKSVQ
jgi:hypothetical protein